MKFTIRDLLWLTVVVALGVAWWVDRSTLATRAAAGEAKIGRLGGRRVGADADFGVTNE